MSIGAANGSADALLATEHVTKAFGGLVAVEDVSFTVRPRSIVSTYMSSPARDAP